MVGEKRDQPLRGRPDVAGDTHRLIETLRRGGTAIVPAALGYAIVGATVEANKRIIAAKGRGTHKRQGMVMSVEAERQIHVLEDYQREMVDCVTQDYQLPLGVIARFHRDHPLMQAVDPYLFEVGTARDTISTVVNAGGPFHEAMGDFSLRELMPIFGSSANLTGTGGKKRVEDIQPEILSAADLVLDYGLRPLHLYARASTQINFDRMEVNRIGSCYELISDILLRHFGWRLPADPGRDVNPSGHLHEFALAQ